MSSPPPPPQLADAVGCRVVVRRKLGTEGGRLVYGDVLGVLLSWSDGVATVRQDNDGSIERIAAADIVAGKPVPPRPPRRTRRSRPDDDAPPADTPSPDTPPTESAEPAESADPAEPAEPTNLADPADLTGPADPADPAGSAGSAGPAASATSATSAASAASAASATSAVGPRAAHDAQQRSRTAQPGQPDQPGQPGQLGQPGQPGQPGQSRQPGQPAAPTPPATQADLARIAADGWPAIETAHLGGWLLQYAEGFTGRANSVVPSGAPDRSLEEALREIRRWYAARGQPALMHVVVGSPVEEWLRARGWVVHSSSPHGGESTDMRVAPLETVQTQLEALGVASIEVTFGELDERWLTVYGRSSASVQSPSVRHVLQGPSDATDTPNPAIALARAVDSTVSDEPAGIARGAVTGAWLGISAITVRPPARRRGVATALLDALCRWGKQQGARWVYLQVSTNNTAAIQLYDRLGFTLDHTYRYYRPKDMVD